MLWSGKEQKPKFFFYITDSFLADRPEAEGLENSISTSGDAIPSVSVSDLSEGDRLMIYAYYLALVLNEVFLIFYRKT